MGGASWLLPGLAATWLCSPGKEHSFPEAPDTCNMGAKSPPAGLGVSPRDLQLKEVRVWHINPSRACST